MDAWEIDVCNLVGMWEVSYYCTPGYCMFPSRMNVILESHEKIIDRVNPDLLFFKVILIIVYARLWKRGIGEEEAWDEIEYLVYVSNKG